MACMWASLTHSTFEEMRRNLWAAFWAEVRLDPTPKKVIRRAATSRSTARSRAAGSSMAAVSARARWLAESSFWITAGTSSSGATWPDRGPASSSLSRMPRDICILNSW